HAEYEREKCVHDLFEEQVQRSPDASAVVSNDVRLTYRELDQRANRLAQSLVTLGVGPDALVALCAQRSIESLVTMLAVLKAGGAYVPFDPAYPRERLAFMLADAGIEVLATQQKLAGSLPEQRARVIYIDQCLAESGDAASDVAEKNVGPGVTPDHLV